MRLRSFYRFYGKYMELIEFAIIGAAVLIFVLQEYSLEFAALTTGPSIFAFLLLTFVHSLILLKVATTEFYPYKSLRINFFNQLLYKVILFFFFMMLTLLLLLGYFLPLEVLLENSLIIALQHVFWINGKIMLILYPIMFGLTDVKICRLSLRTVLIGLKLIDMKEKDKTRLVSKYLRLFLVGLKSYNSHLYKRKPKHISIVEINKCYSIVHCVGLFGSSKERIIIAKQIRRALDSIKGPFRPDNFRQLLIALKNIRNLEDRKNYSTLELSHMIKITSFSERAKEFLVSSWFLMIVSLIPNIITFIEKILPLILK